MNEASTKQVLDLLRWINHEATVADMILNEYKQAVESIKTHTKAISGILKENMDV